MAGSLYQSSPFLPDLTPDVFKKPPIPRVTNPSFMGSQAAAIPSPALGASPSLFGGSSPFKFEYDSPAMNEFFGKAPDASAIGSTTNMPDKLGGWVEGGKLALGVAEVGLGVYSALEQAKMNKFMRGYYGDQMDMQKTDFANSAKSVNNELSAREARRLDAMGGAPIGSAENQAAVDEYMKKWGVQENF